MAVERQSMMMNEMYPQEEARREWPPHEEPRQTAYQQENRPPVLEHRIYISYSPKPGQLIQPAHYGESNIIAALSYVFGWLSGLYVFLFASQNRLARFHAVQSMLFFGLINLIDIAFVFSFGWWHWLHWSFPFPVSALSVLAVLGLLALLHLAGFIGWLLGMIQAGRGRFYKLPLVGEIAWRSVARDEVVLK